MRLFGRFSNTIKTLRAEAKHLRLLWWWCSLFLTLQDFRDFLKKVCEKPSRKLKKKCRQFEKKCVWVVRSAAPEIIHLPSLTNGYRGWKAVGNRLEKGRSFFSFPRAICSWTSLFIFKQENLNEATKKSRNLTFCECDFETTLVDN